MKYEPILKVKIKKFGEDFGYSNDSADALFERFINNLVLTMHQPDCTTKNSSLLEFTSVGGNDDMGIDGIGVKVNGIFVTSKKEIDNIVEQSGRVSAEFIFIQSKNKDRIDSGEFSKFADGIYAFLGEECYEPHNEKIAEVLEIKNYIFSDEIMMYWRDAPQVRSYYVIFGEWRADSHIEGKTAALNAKIESLNSYCDYCPRFLGTQEIAKIYEENSNGFKITINVLGAIEFEEVPDVSNSQVILCKATEFLKLLNTEEGVIRKSLFSDNVRDFQGRTIINQGMIDTIANSPSSFLLLNNGITVVCSELHSSNRKVTLTNPQIVNGCQTSSVLYYSKDSVDNLDDVCVLVKIIATEKSDITNAIVQGTNSQNPVFIESFEITKEFHKKLEEFINAYQSDFYDTDSKIYYERRSKQYEGNPTIKKYQTFSLDVLAHLVVGIFMQAPHDSVLHIVNLLNKYANAIFVDTQSLLPYYTAAYMGLSFERMMANRIIDRKYDTYKYFVLAIAAEKIAGEPLKINSRAVDKDCKKIIDVVRDPDQYKAVLVESINLFSDIQKKWVNKYGSKYMHGIKDNPSFTNFLYTVIRGGNVDKLDLSFADSVLEKQGTVISSKQDRAGRYYGFIGAYPDNVFFHEEDNPNIDFSRIIGKTVTYTSAINERNGKNKAYNVRVI